MAATSSTPSDSVVRHLDSDDDLLFEQLEKDLEHDAGLLHLRELRMEQLQHEIRNARDMKLNAHGTYTEITDEKEVLRITTSVHCCIVHFFHADFRRCAIIDRHFEFLSKKHFNTRFIRVNVDNTPFLVDRLNVKVLPCVVSFIDSISKDRLVGFEELGNTDDFPTALLERRLIKVGVINAITDPSLQHQPPQSVLHYSGGNESDDDSE